MPIPSPADFRNKSKKHSEVREMLAQMAESVESKADATTKANAAKSEAIAAAATDATTKANAAEANAKTYADTNKLDLSKIGYEYVDGNMIGSKSPRYTNLGISGGIVVNGSVDSLVLRVKGGDVLYMHNNTQNYTSGAGSRFMFFAEDPNLNRTQTNIAHTATTLTDAASSIIYQKVTVPTGAKYLMINTRTVTGSGTHNLTWAVHKDSFNASFVAGKEGVDAIQGVPVGTSGDDLKKAKEYTDAQLLDVEKLKTSTKNLFTGEVITRRVINSLGAQLTSNDNDVISDFVPVVSGNYYTISGLDLSLINSIQMRISGYSDADLGSANHVKQVTNVVWSGNTCTFLVDDPAIKFVLFPLSTNGFGTLEKALDLSVQLELGQVATSYEPYKFTSNELKLYRAKAYTDAQLLDVEKLKTSTKNLFTGEVITRRIINDLGAQLTSNDNDVVSDFVPVVPGNYYTISGLDLSLINGIYLRISGYSDANLAPANHVKRITNAVWTGNTCTFLVDDPAIKFVLFPLSTNGFGTLEKALDLSVQLELGQVATSYEPYKFTDGSLKLYKAGLAKSAENIAELVANIKPKFVNNFTEVNKVRDSISTLTSFEKNISPLGLGYSLNGSDGIKNKSNVLYAQIPITEAGTKSIYAHVATYIQSAMAYTKLKSQPFTTPSGQVDNPDSIVDTKTYGNAEYCHPSIAYDATGVAGFKYWMITSILPAGGSEGVKWEDEDLFVSNDAKDWQRVRSLYETDKSYTTAQLRLPPQTLATTSARKHAFLPCPAAGDVIEISVPADNGAPALDRVNITIIPTVWKYDPAILIDGGYVYTYHSFHLPYVDRDGGKNKFVVCVRTNDGINWEVVRSDGSTMLLTEETSRQIFTKDDQGRYNYMYYGYIRNYGNPEIIKWGENDYELYYGGNFNFKVKGTTPYNFDFSAHYPVQEKAPGNHPGLLKSGNDLYLATNDGFYKSTDRGATFTALADYPFWLGGFTGFAYKKAMCIGESGKVILAEVQRFVLNGFSAPVGDDFSTANGPNLMFIYEYTSVAELISMANKLNDAYVDIQLCKVNYADSTRQYYIKPALGMTKLSASVQSPLQRVKITDIECKAGDVLHLYITLNARNAASVNFGGIEVS